MFIFSFSFYKMDTVSFLFILVVVIVIIVCISKMSKPRHHKRHHKWYRGSSSNASSSDGLKDPSIFATDESFGVETTHDGSNYVDYINNSSQYISKNIDTDTIIKTSALYNFDFDTVKNAFSYISTKLGALALVLKMSENFEDSSLSSSYYDEWKEISGKHYFGLQSSDIYIKIYSNGYVLQGDEEGDEEGTYLNNSFIYSEWKNAFNTLNTMQEKFALIDAIEYLTQ